MYSLWKLKKASILLKRGERLAAFLFISHEEYIETHGLLGLKNFPYDQALRALAMSYFNKKKAVLNISYTAPNNTKIRAFIYVLTHPFSRRLY